MDTISNLAGAASNAIWGSSTTTDTEEPVSGKQGAGNVSEPFDKGNEENQTTGTGGVASNTTTTPAPASTSGANPNNNPSTTGMPEHNNAPQSGIDSDKNRDGPSEAQSSDVVGDPKSGATTEPAKPTGDSSESKIRTGKDGKPEMPRTDSEREALVNKGEFPHDPNDHSGEPLKMHDGPDKKTESSEPKDDPREDGKTDRSNSVSQEGGQPHGKGTGDKVVKASGLEADGGDFDATKPGAGQEATRLAEEKGIKSDHKPPAATEDPAARTKSPSESEKAKVSKMAKLKEKLHIGSGKNLDKK